MNFKYRFIVPSAVETQQQVLPLLWLLDSITKSSHYLVRFVD